MGRRINLPLLVRDICPGTLSIGSAQTGEPEPEELEFLRQGQVVAQVAFAIDHVRAYEQIDRLHLIPIVMPLRDRSGARPRLARHFVERH